MLLWVPTVSDLYINIVIPREVRRQAQQISELEEIVKINQPSVKPKSYD